MFLSNGSFWSTSLYLLAIYIVGRIIYRLYFHPLAKFPGPKLAAATLWYEFYYDVIQEGQYTWRIAELHKEYGPIVRISPHEIHVSDPKFHNDLYRQDGRTDKYAWTYDAFGAPDATICTADHDLHKRRKAPIENFLSDARVRDREGMVREKIVKLRQRVMGFAKSGTKFNLRAALNALFTDISSTYMLGSDQHYLDMEDFNQSVANLLHGGNVLWRISKHIRGMAKLAQSLPLSWLEKSGDPNMPAFITYLRKTQARVDDLVARNHEKQVNGAQPQTLVDAILEHPTLPPVEKASPRIKEDIETALGAGFGVPTQATSLTLFYLYHNPGILARLREELMQHSAKPSIDWEDLSLRELEQLPYLTAVIKEGLRLSPGSASRLPRIARDRQLECDGYIIPAGTPVSMSPLLLHLDPNTYPEPRRFDPDRWTGTADTEGQDLRIFVPFSRGSRMCLGHNLAWAELRMILAMFAMTFDLDLGDTSKEDVDVYIDNFLPTPKTERGVRVIPSVFREA